MSESNDRSAPVPILPYSGPANENAARAEQLNALLIANVAPDSFYPLFSLPFEAVEWYANAKAEQFSPERAGESCANCGSNNSLTLTRVVWRAKVPQRWLILPLIYVGAIRFSTHHQICRRCRRRWFWRVELAVWLRGLMYVIGLPIAGFVAWQTIAHVVPSDNSVYDWNASILWIFIAVFCIGLSMYLHWLGYRLRKPARLSALVPDPIRCIDCEDYTKDQDNSATVERHITL
jgi:hypothetical protein